MDLPGKLFFLRKSKGLTQAELGKLAGVTEGAIRGYETGARNPKKEHLQKIAAALNVTPEAIADYNATTQTEIIQLLTRLEDDEEFKLRPIVNEGRPLIEFQNDKIQQAIKDWSKKRSARDDGTISNAEYEEWLNRFRIG